MYCFFTTVPVAFYWARSDNTVHYKSDEMVNDVVAHLQPQKFTISLDF